MTRMCRSQRLVQLWMLAVAAGISIGANAAIQEPISDYWATLGIGSGPPGSGAPTTSTCTAATIIAHLASEAVQPANAVEKSNEIKPTGKGAKTDASKPADSDKKTTDVPPPGPGANNDKPYYAPSPTLNPGSATWNDEINITFTAVDPKLAKCLEATDLILFLDHYPLADLKPVTRIANTDQKTATITFRLTRPSSTSQSWNVLMTKDWKEDKARKVDVGIGTGNVEFAVSKDPFTLSLGRGGSGLVCAFLAASLAALVTLGCWESAKTLLDRRKDGVESYSLSRLLLGCWVLTTISAVALAVIRTGTIPSASQGWLVSMLTISGTTAGASALIDLLKPLTAQSSDAWEDLFYDADGLALHRLQVLIFSLVVLTIVWRDMIQLGTVTEIDSGWAALLGVSSLTYLFGKTGESK